MSTPKRFSALTVTAITVLSVSACSIELSAGSTSEEETATEAPTDIETTSETSSAEETTSSSSSSSSPSSSSSSSTTSSSSGDDETEDFNEYDGVSTLDFFAALGEVEGMHATDRESDPKKLRTSAKLFNEDESLRADVFIFIPTPDGEPAPVKSHSDEGLKNAYESARDVFEEEGHDVEETEITTKNLEWKCVEAQQSQGDGDIDHAICDAAFAGRVIDVQRIILHDDRDQKDKQLDTLLEKVDAALDTLK
ncbi:hypothetical protein [Corynebacterium sp. Marseille-P3884]|uniref:hypothetical protein n=1 Tax=Corynebacterium sp. Marseille-P3884 TaxID=2495409 RepID=UPI001B324C0B|nr:hypothetical protein [Corynebacterium sp. Marseille-P3884]MBP3949324.1 hypothetical protein [Corynebacterium sp. Marseille-P3884]